MAEPTLKHAIAHLLHRDELVLSEEPLEITPVVSNYLANYFSAANSSAKKRAAAFDGVVVKSAVERALEGGDDLLAASQELAERLHRLVSDDMRISISVLLVCVVETPADGCYVGIFKLDPADGLTPTVREEDGSTVVEFEIAHDVMPTSREALQKSAIVPDPTGSPEYDLYVVDAQSRGPDIAKFFLTDFLEAEYALTDADRTNRFVRAITNAKNTLVPESSPAEILSIDAGFRAALRSDQVNADQFVDQLSVSDRSRDVLRDELREHLPDREFDIDSVIAKRALRKRIFKGDHGLKLEVPADHFEDLVSIEVDDEGRRIVTITTKKWEEQG